MSEPQVGLLVLGNEIWYKDGDAYRLAPRDTSLNSDRDCGKYLAFPWGSEDYERYPNGKRVSGAVFVANQDDVRDAQEKSDKADVERENKAVEIKEREKKLGCGIDLNAPLMGMTYVTGDPEPYDGGYVYHYVVHDPFNVGFDFYTNAQQNRLYYKEYATDEPHLKQTPFTINFPEFPDDEEGRKRALYWGYEHLITNWNKGRYRAYLDSPIVTGLYEEDDVGYKLRLFPAKPEASYGC